MAAAVVKKVVAMAVVVVAVAVAVWPQLYPCYYWLSCAAPPPGAAAGLDAPAGVVVALLPGHPHAVGEAHASIH